MESRTKTNGVTSIDARVVAEMLGVTPLELAGFLRQSADQALARGTKIVLNDPWYSHDDWPESRAKLLDLAERAARLCDAAFAFELAWEEDHPDLDA